MRSFFIAHGLKHYERARIFIEFNFVHFKTQVEIFTEHVQLAVVKNEQKFNLNAMFLLNLLK